VGAGRLGGLGGALERAIERRRSLVDDPAVTALRVVSGRSDGVAGLFVDLLGPAAVADVYEGTPADAVDPRELAGAVLAALSPLGARGVYLKRFGADRSRLGGVPAETTDAQPMAGDRTAAEIPVREDGRTLLARPYDGFSTGVFVDQRANRRWLGEWVAARSAAVGDGSAGVAPGVSVLNLFAYTGAFGLAAACAARSGRTSNVDVSGRYLGWAERNYGANGIALCDDDGSRRHHFPRMDARDFVTMAGRKGWRFDAVVIDPPSYGAADRKKRTPAWSIEKDYGALIREAGALIPPGGVCLCVTNNRSLCEAGALEGLASSALGRGFRGVELPPPDADVASERGRTAAAAFIRR
jgi:23S rRNA (cytosine1962-C5)-methyltransferase